MTLPGADALAKLNKRQIRVLQAIEVGMKRAQYVEIELIAKYAGYPVSRTEKLLQECHKFDLIHRWTGHFVGYELTINGYDTLALNALYEKGFIRSIGREKGVGKESRVFYALTADDKEVVLKLHRVGYTSFQHVKKKRRYTANKKHISELYASRLSAETEMKWLKRANKLDLPVPNILGGNRHILILELIDGLDLIKLNDLPNPVETLEIILDFIDTCWNDGGFVHGDMSEHNIIMQHENAKPIIIDFPQAVDIEAENSKELLQRDVSNILTYFYRKHGLNSDDQLVLNNILNR